jgi:hypothetical protein
MLHVAIVVTQLALTPCGPMAIATLQAASREMLRGESDVTGTLPDSCAEAAVARLALQGWHAARAVAPKGGAAELLEPARAAVKALDQFAVTNLTLEAQYAQTVINAAIAAAQDERGDLQLLLTHARDLSERLATRGRAAMWPRSFNLLAGELWFEVDRFADARAAFERAMRVEPTALAAAGLARAAARLGDHAAACAAYRLIHDAAASLADEARAFLARCP